MWGAIIGDIVGSVYEWKPIKTKEFEFFGPPDDHPDWQCSFTDDTVCTAAVADIILNGHSAAPAMQRWCRRHGGRGYGGNFRKWIDSRDPRPYRSWGNGAAMRVSPAAFVNRNDLEAAFAASDRVTAISHNHPEGLKGARATVHSIWLALNGEDPEAIRTAIAREYGDDASQEFFDDSIGWGQPHGYRLERTVDEIRPNYRFYVSCRGTVPEAITCALESTSFEDAIRNAVSLGGDSDTLAAIAGPIAEGLHGIPEEMLTFTRDRFLDNACQSDRECYHPANCKRHQKCRKEAPDIAIMREMYAQQR